MKKTFLTRLICIAAALVMCLGTAFGEDVSRSLVRLAADTEVFSDPGMRDSCGVIPAGSVVYANGYQAENPVLEIVFCYGFIIRTGYISPAAGILPLTDAEAEEYTAGSSEGIVYRPGIILMNVALTEALPSESGPEGLPFDPAANAEAVPEASFSPDNSAANDFEVVSEFPGFVTILYNTAAFTDPALEQVFGIIPSGTVAYAASPAADGGALEVVVCLDYIIRTLYIPDISAAPLTEEEEAAYAANSSEGIVYRPGIVLMNYSLLGGVTPAQQAVPAENTAGGLPGAGQESAAVSETPAPTAAPTSEPESAPAKEELFPEKPENGVAPLPVGKRYLLNPGEPIPKGSELSTITLPVYTPGLAEGVIDFAVLNDGVYIVVTSVMFSQDVVRGAENAVIRVSYTCKNSTYVLVRYSPTSTCRFAMKTGRRVELNYFNDNYGVFLKNPVVVPGYTIDCKFRY